jgi:hypothetical protein
MNCPSNWWLQTSWFWSAQFGERPTFRMNISPPFSEPKNRPSRSRRSFRTALSYKSEARTSHGDRCENLKSNSVQVVLQNTKMHQVKLSAVWLLNRGSIHVGTVEKFTDVCTCVSRILKNKRSPSVTGVPSSVMERVTTQWTRYSLV